MNANQIGAFEVGLLAEHMVWGCKAHIAAIHIVPGLDCKTVFQFKTDHPTDFVQRKDGTKLEFPTFQALVSGGDETLEEELNRVWLIGSLLAVGDALQEHKYFDHAPELELVYHLRNGVAHGNRFNITNLQRLAKYPAHNRGACYKSPKSTIFEITPALNGTPVLPDFMEAGDVLDLLSSVGSYLKQLPRTQPTP